MGSNANGMHNYRLMAKRMHSIPNRQDCSKYLEHNDFDGLALTKMRTTRRRIIKPPKKANRIFNYNTILLQRNTT